MEQKRNILDLSNAIKCTPENTKCSQGARSERLKMIENFELKFDVKLPSSYISYITSVDWAPKIFDEINYLNNTGIKLDLVEINYELRNEDISYPTIPNYLIAISRGHDDNYFCFDREVTYGNRWY